MLLELTKALYTVNREIYLRNYLITDTEIHFLN